MNLSSVVILWTALAEICLATATVIHWNSTTCVNVFQSHDKVEGTGCVAAGSIPSVKRNCPGCVFNYQCESGWCHKDWKVCYDRKVGGCSKKTRAGCKDCSSEKGTDLSKCECEDANFPNNWVDCTDGSGEIDTYDLEPDFLYERKENADGSLDATDLFAVNAQCYHNKHRENAGEPPLQWNNELALYAKNWANHLKETNECKLYHSSNDQRKDYAGFWQIGENLFRKAIVGNVQPNEIPAFGGGATEGWFGELINYQYAGPNAGAGQCPFRNEDEKKNPAVLHLTAVMWAKSTDMGCDYAICGPNKKGKSYMTVACMYGPTGNVGGQAPFNDTVFCHLRDQYEVIKQFGLVPRCDGLSRDCDDMESWAEAEDLEDDLEEETTAAPEEEESDGICITKKGFTCKFPWTKKGFGTFTSCGDAIEKRGKPWCFTEEKKWDKCPNESSDPDCSLE